MVGARCHVSEAQAAKHNRSVVSASLTCLKSGKEGQIKRAHEEVCRHLQDALGWGDWRRSFVLFGLFFLLCFESWAIFKSVRFAFLATGLDAVQRLEQKNRVVCNPNRLLL